MARTSYKDMEPTEKVMLLPKAPDTTYTWPGENLASKRRPWFIGTLIAFIIFVSWSSGAISSLLGLGRHDKHEDIRQLDFEDVCPSI